MCDISFEIFDFSGLDLLCRVLSEFLPDGAVVVLSGTLGGGKTCLVQGIASYLGIGEGVVMSPTFVLVREYEGERWVYHFDVYRLSSEAEFRQLDPDDYFDRGGLTFIEWGDKFPQVLPEERLEIKIEITGETSRKFQITSTGTKFDQTMEALKKSITSL
ncbi:MAG: tRNA (adenosine(37)-N6)-threonylcarbamoyltransferase complex ATPase subunit type 1 TsaE [Planctomycetaceae bacterium]|nr:tRNA (adenosine(37)-N6)-threonylcarbamoyltransferase complex ATPase subunit type 1 TsaE [Planctomycetaceae bacterium]